MIKTSWISLLRLAVNDKMVRESMSNLLVLLVCCLLSPFCISHHNAENGELPIFVIPRHPAVRMSEEVGAVSL
jgi:hypothetical protein